MPSHPSLPVPTYLASPVGLTVTVFILVGPLWYLIALPAATRGLGSWYFGTFPGSRAILVPAPTPPPDLVAPASPSVDDSIIRPVALHAAAAHFATPLVRVAGEGSRGWNDGPETKRVAKVGGDVSQGPTGRVSRTEGSGEPRHGEAAVEHGSSGEGWYGTRSHAHPPAQAPVGADFDLSAGRECGSWYCPRTVSRYPGSDSGTGHDSTNGGVGTGGIAYTASQYASGSGVTSRPLTSDS